MQLELVPQALQAQLDLQVQLAQLVLMATPVRQALLEQPDLQDQLAQQVK